MLTIHDKSVYNSKAVSDTATVERDLSSAGRASALQAEGHRFEPYRSHLMSLSHYAGVAELADAPDLGSGAERRTGSSPARRTIFPFRLIFFQLDHSFSRRDDGR